MYTLPSIGHNLKYTNICLYTFHISWVYENQNNHSLSMFNFMKGCPFFFNESDFLILTIGTCTSVNQNLGWMWIWWTCKAFFDLHSRSMCWSASCWALLSDMQKFDCQIWEEKRNLKNIACLNKKDNTKDL